MGFLSVYFSLTDAVENLLWVSEVEHKLLHIAKKKDELSYYQFIAELRKQQPIKQEDNAISLENWVEVA